MTVAAVSCLAGCQTDPDAGKIQLRYMAWGSPEQMALEEKFCAEFNRRNPDVHVRFFRVPGSAYLNKAIIMFASRTAPDVVRIDHFNFPDLVRKDYFYDLTELARKDPGFHPDDFFPQTIREGTYRGRLYGLNVMFGGWIMYYNRTLVKQAGLVDPYVLAKQGKWTYDRLRDYAVRITKFDERGRPLRFGVAIPNYPFTTPTIWAFGGQVLSPDHKRCLLDSPGTIRAYQYLADLRWKDHCSPTPSQAANSAFSFESGKLGFEFNWMGMAPRYNSAIKDFDWDICPLPRGPFGGKSMVKGNQLVVYRESKHPDVAWRFIRFLTSPETETQLYVVNRRNFPTRKSVAYSRAFLKPTCRPYQADVYLRTVENAGELPIDARWSEWTNAFGTVQDDLYSGRERSAAVAMRRAKQKVDEVLSDEEGF